MVIETEKYKLSSSVYANRIVAKLFAKWWWAFAIPVAVCLALSFVSLRWLIVAFAFVLIVYPLLLMIAYFNHALNADTVRGILEQKAFFDNRGITITYYGKGVSPDLLKPRRITPDEIASWEDTGRYLGITLKDGTEIYIPVKAIPDPVGATYFLRSI